MMKRADPVSFLPLTPAVFHILLALAPGERHGYAVMREVERRAGGVVRMGPGTLYGSLKRMMAVEFIQETGSAEAGGERRRLYGLTPLGRAVLQAEAARLESLVRDARAARVLPRTRKA